MIDSSQVMLCQRTHAQVERAGCWHRCVNHKKCIDQWVNPPGANYGERIRNSPTMKLYKNGEWLKEQYIQKRKSTRQIGLICNVNGSTIQLALIAHDIPRRARSDYKRNGECRSL